MLHGSKYPTNLSQPVNNLKNMPPDLIGDSYEAHVYLNDVRCPCLIDTGAQVSIISESFHKQYLSHVPIEPLANILTTEGAGGHSVKYTGYCVLDVTFPPELDSTLGLFPTPILVASETEYTKRIPLILGTNILKKLSSIPQLFHRMVPSDVTELHQTFVTAYRSVVVHTDDPDGNLGDIHPLHTVTIPPGATHNIPVKIKAGPLTESVAVLVEEKSSNMPSGLLVKEGIVSMSSTGKIHVPVVNNSIRPVTVNKRTTFASISIPDKISPIRESDLEEENVFDEIEVGPVPELWKKRVKNMIHQYNYVFSHNDLDLGCTDKVKHRITLTDDTPFKERSRPIRPGDLEDVRDHLKELLDAGVIRESMSPFASPIVVCRKKSGKIRMTIDYRILNNRTVKDSYNLPKIEDILMCLNGSKWFTTLDLKSSYYQVEMHEEDKEKTWVF